MRRGVWGCARPVGGAAILALVVWRLGTGPILHGLRTVSGRSLAAAAGITAVTTVCSAWRWSVVARGLGVAIPLRTAITAYYRSQFLNTVLPGGVLGDVHRGLRHGRNVGDVGRALRAVAWERFAGQFVQLGLALVLLGAFPSPLRASWRILAPPVLVGGLAIALLARLLRNREGSWGPILRAELRDGLLARRGWPRILFASVIVVAGHAVTFVIAARTAGSTASVAKVLPLAMLVLLAMAVPANIAGWGLREGVAAWMFGVAGLGSAQGVAAATVYGVMVFVASLPGAVVLVMMGRWRARVALDPPPAAPAPLVARASPVAPASGARESRRPVTVCGPAGAGHG